MGAEVLGFSAAFCVTKPPEGGYAAYRYIRTAPLLFKDEGTSLLSFSFPDHNLDSNETQEARLP